MGEGKRRLCFHLPAWPDAAGRAGLPAGNVLAIGVLRTFSRQLGQRVGPQNMQALLGTSARPLRPAALAQRAPAGLRAPLPRPTTRRMVRRAASSPSSSATAAPSTAKEAVERGLEVFAAGDTEGALALFLRAQQLSPNADEACAACYNAGAPPPHISHCLRLLHVSWTAHGRHGHPA